MTQVIRTKVKSVRLKLYIQDIVKEHLRPLLHKQSTWRVVIEAPGKSVRNHILIVLGKEVLDLSVQEEQETK